MVILGYNCYVFDSAACLVVDGKVVAAVQEERLTRKKGTGDFPENAIRYCLDSQGLSIDDVDQVAFYWQPLLGIHHRFIQIFKNLPHSLNFWSSHSDKWLSMFFAEKELRKRFPSKNKKSKFHFRNVPHHIAHAAGSFFISPYEKSAILVMDGSGEITSTSLAVGSADQIKILKEIPFPHSMGYLYVALTHYLGFKPDSDEYKVMALASMGERSVYYDEFCKIIQLKESGGYRFDLSYFNYQKGIKSPWVSQKFIDIMGPLREKNSKLEKRQYDIAWALQKRLEDVSLHCAEFLHEQTGLETLSIGGGCGLNCVMNEVLRQKSSFKNIWAVPAPHDAGTSIGAALWVQNHILKQPRKYIMEDAYLGPSFSDEAIESVLRDQSIPFVKLEDKELFESVAEFIAEGKVIGWFQGRSEFGPRALGNRSLLADPRRDDMKDIMNKKIKHREAFRPFAPACLEEKVKDYFVEGRKLPFMVFVLSAKKEVASKIPAVVHTDGTSRVQTVNKTQNPRFYSLISAFEKKTGIPMLLNTSFNDSGEPIVNTPAEALRTFKATNLDCLVLGSYLVLRKEIL
jgi:carbamoyltransferase